MAGFVEAVEKKERNPHAADSSLRYMPGLDVARALAIVLVLGYHSLANFISLDHAATDWQSRVFVLLEAIGSHGVHLFFVLSGFLITGILLDSRGRSNYYGTFYLRRALRIMPASLLVLFGLWAAHWITWRFLLATLLYCANLPRLFGTTTEYGVMWSLSVEEQFYLVWPFVVRRLKPHTLASVCIAMIVLTPLLRLLLQYGPAGLSDITFKTWAVCDFFAAGALIALAVRIQDWSHLLPRMQALCLIAGVVLVPVVSLLILSGNGLTAKLLASVRLEPWLLLCSGVVIAAFLHPSIARSAAAAPALFLAKVSYGLYLVHPIVFRLVERYWVLPNGASLQSISPHIWSVFVLRGITESLIAVAIAAISRFTLEEFFLRLKPKHS